MSSPFRLVRQLSAGPDGVSYLGVDEQDHRSVTVDRLFLARRFPPRWTELRRRLQLVAELEHEHVLPVRVWKEEGADPYLVTDRLEKTLTDAWDAGEIEPQLAVDWVRALACALAQGHRLGLVHGEICPSSVVMAEGGRPLADLCGVRTGSRRLTERDRVFFAGDGAPSPASDVFALGALCVYLWSGQPPAIPEEPREPIRVSFGGDRRLAALLSEMLDRDPVRRPSIHEVVDRLRRVEHASAPESTAIFEKPRTDPLSRRRLGRFELCELLGEGAMGRVYRARDMAGGPDVALKLLRPHFAEERDALRRFYREARVLSELDNPHIARFFEVNEDEGLHYLAMEYIEGQSLGAHIDQEKALPVERALSLLHDLAGALADVHDLGIVHRDIKPSNVLLVTAPDGGLSAKLCDFGIARPVSGDELTQVGFALGTPHYMAPEQGSGADVDARSDIYALGITLFKMLTGEVPFNASDPRAVLFKHLTEPVPDVTARCPDLGPAGVALLTRMLAKVPAERFANGRELLEALERMHRGEPARMAQHPRSPDTSQPLTYDFEWRLASSPAALWPHVSNTERLNRAIGLEAVEFRRRVQSGQVETFGKVRLTGLLLDWREHRYEWVAPQRMGVLRELSQGPFVWLKSSVELVPLGRGTLLRHQIQLEPRGVLGRAAASLEVGLKAKRNLERVYQRIDRYLSRGFTPEGTALLPTGEALVDPFEEPPKLEEHQLERIRLAEEQLLDLRLDDEVVTRLCDFVRWATPQEVARIRPRAFARRFTLDHREVLRACLHGAKAGLLVMLWDVVCPRCQIPSSIEDSLRALRDHARCDACDVDFELDFGRSIEIVFRAHPEVRKSELGTYCIGGPGHMPHVIAQVRLAPRERFAMELRLDEGHYRVTGPSLPIEWGFSVRHGAPLADWELNLASGLSPSAPRAVSSGKQRIVLVNDFDREVVARVERTGAREDAVTAAEVACTSAFRELFPGEALAPGRLVSVGKVTLLLAELTTIWSDRADEAQAFARLMELARSAADVAEQEGGAVVKLMGDGVLVSFDGPLAGARAALALARDGLRIAVHTGAAMATSINQRLDYFGHLVRELDTLAAAAAPGQTLLSERLCGDPGVAALLAPSRDDASLVFIAGVVAQAFPAKKAC